MQTTTSENHDSLINSSRVEGTAVYNLEGEQIGSIEHLMLEKRGGRVAHAVMSFGGFLGIGEEHYPIPWSKLTYDTELGGYRVDITKEQLGEAPSHPAKSGYDWYDRSNEERIYNFYGVPPYWL